MEHRWDRLTASEIGLLAAEGAVVILPVASLEQHGPHLPVWTDSMIGHAVALAGAKLAKTPTLVLPPMWMGLSEHDFPFGGTISLDYPTFHSVLRCVCRSILADGFKRLLLLNSHGGNIEPLAVSVRELAHEFAIPVVTTTVTKLAPEAFSRTLTTQSGMQHACEAESSLWLHLDPKQVRQDEISRALSLGGFSTGDAAASRFWSFAERAPVTGVRGDPRAATAEKGDLLLGAMADGLSRMIDDPHLWATPDPVWAAGRAQRAP